MKKNPLFCMGFFLLLCFSGKTFSQDMRPFIQIETNKTLCVLNFLETATAARGTSASFQQFILDSLGADQEFQLLLTKYRSINLNYQLERKEFPQNRHAYRTVKDFLWIMSSNSSDIADFSDRIIGLLPNQAHQSLIDAMKQAEPYYESLVWDKEQAYIKRIEGQLSPYKSKIEELFLTISKFYGANWSKSIPFKIMLYPIPLESGITRAIPKGNALICSFLSRNERDFEGRLGVIIHEMCHILFDEQSLQLQKDIDNWFINAPSEWSKLAYSYLDEGLATAIGNGWAFEQIHGYVDSTSWYNNPYIEGFAHALFPMVSKNLAEGKTMDEAFVSQAIAAFEDKFPEAVRELDILMNEITLFSNTEEGQELDFIAQNMRKNFQIRSQWFSTPIEDENTVRLFDKDKTTKFFIVEKAHSASLDFLGNKFPDLEKGLESGKNFLYTFKDSQTQSAVVLINLHELDGLPMALSKLRESKYIEFGKYVEL